MTKDSLLVKRNLLFKYIVSKVGPTHWLITDSVHDYMFSDCPSIAKVIAKLMDLIDPDPKASFEYTYITEAKDRYVLSILRKEDVMPIKNNTKSKKRDTNKIIKDKKAETKSVSKRIANDMILDTLETNQKIIQALISETTSINVLRLAEIDKLIKLFKNNNYQSITVKQIHELKAIAGNIISYSSQFRDLGNFLERVITQLDPQIVEQFINEYTREDE